MHHGDLALRVRLGAVEVKAALNIRLLLDFTELSLNKLLELGIVFQVLHYRLVVQRLAELL